MAIFGITRKDLLIAIEIAKYSLPEMTKVYDDPFDDSFFIRDKSQYLKLKFDDIRLFKASGIYTEIHTHAGTRVIRSLLKNIEERLPKRGFIRIHKSYIVNMSAVNGINSGKVYLDQEVIPISREVQSELMSKLRIL